MVFYAITMERLSEEQLRNAADELLQACRKAGVWLATAESCTGGCIGGTITAIPGSSDVFWGGIIAYQNEVKAQLLQVSDRTLAHAGAVSKQCAEEMAQGAVTQVWNGKPVLAVAVTGIAGPGGALPEKPVGTVWIGVAWRIGRAVGVETDLFRFEGDRDAVRSQTVFEALTMARACLEKVSQ